MLKKEIIELFHILFPGQQQGIQYIQYIRSHHLAF